MYPGLDLRVLPIHRLVALLGSFVLILGGLLVGAQGAHAATASPSPLVMDFWCERWNSSPGPDQTIETVTGDVGDTFRIVKGTGAGCNNTQTITGASGIVTPGTGTMTRSTTTTFTLVASGTFTLTGGGGTGVMTIIVVATAPGGGGGGAGGGGGREAAPADIFQGVAMSVIEGCASINRTDLDWGGAETGNWSQSWAQWPNGGAGGPVCQRVLWYDPVATRWRSTSR